MKQHAAERVSVSAAAAELEVGVSTVRKWIAKGAPCASPGGSGRGRGATVVVADLKVWRQGAKTAAAPIASGIDPRELGRFIQDFYRAGDHRLVGLKDEGAQLYLATLFEYIALRAGVAELEVDGIELFAPGNRAAE